MGGWDLLQNIFPAVPEMEAECVVHSGHEHKVCLWKIALYSRQRIPGSIHAQPAFKIGHKDVRFLLHDPAAQIHSVRIRHQALALFKRIMRCYKPPYEIKAKRLKRYAADMDVTFMRRIE